MVQAAGDCAVPFVKCGYGTDFSTRAIGLFIHPGVQAHPGDKGMALIAARISEALFPPHPDRTP